METRIVIFLGFVSIALITNTLLIWFAYKTLTGLTSKVTETVSMFVTNTEANKWIASLRSASEQAVAVTEATKVRITECQSVVEEAQQKYRLTLNKVDSTLGMVADEITTNAKKAQAAVSGPAFSFIAFAAGLMQVLEDAETEE
jgi:hypothetical protein